MSDIKFIENDKYFSGKYAKNVFQTLRLSFSEYKIRVYFLLALGMLGRLFLLFNTNLMGYWVDSLCRGPQVCRPVPKLLESYGHADYVSALISLAVVGFLINTVFRVAISRTGTRAVGTLYDEVTLRTSRLPMTFFDTTPVGRIVTRFGSDYGGVNRMAGGPLGEFLCLIFDLIVIVFLTVLASLWFLPVIGLVIFANFLVYRRCNVTLRKERRALAQLRGPSIAHFAETVQGATAIKVFGKRKSFVARYQNLLGDLLSQKMSTVRAVQSFAFSMNVISAVMLLSTGLAGIILVERGYVSVGSVAVAFTFIMMTATTTQQFFEWLANMEEALTGVERMDDYLRRPLEPGARLPQATKFDLGEIRAPAIELAQALASANLTKAGASSRIVFANFNLRYRDHLPLVLADLDFAIEPGEFFAVIGRTGSGKSSLISALFCLYLPESGGITIGEQGADFSMREANECLVTVEKFRKNMSLIPQDPNLFRGSFRENLTCRRDVSDERLWAILKLIGIAQWVASLNSSGRRALDYFIDEGGRNLSLGERQLVCMARALLQDAPIMIMDEATSSVDPASEELLVRATREHMKDKTRIVVAHRLSTIEGADRVLWLDQGRVRMLDRPNVVLPQFLRSES
jgi:ATP-binding cassette, subfamily B, multidrug efflux pump